MTDDGIYSNPFSQTAVALPTEQQSLILLKNVLRVSVCTISYLRCARVVRIRDLLWTRVHSVLTRKLRLLVVKPAKSHPSAFPLSHFSAGTSSTRTRTSTGSWKARVRARYCLSPVCLQLGSIDDSHSIQTFSPTLTRTRAMCTHTQGSTSRCSAAAAPTRLTCCWTGSKTGMASVRNL